MDPDATYRQAATVVDALVRGGVRHVVLSPGARSGPLALCAADRAELRLWTVPDERSAAFFALGVGLASGVPAAFVCTSGTAGANAYPAVIEAAMAGVPLVVVTADRPPELHGVGALQTIPQGRLYGAFAEVLDLPPVSGPGGTARHVAWSLARALALQRGRGGVLHVNVALREPLEPPRGPLPPPWPGGEVVAGFAVPSAPDPRALDAAAELLRGAARPVVVAGPCRPDAAARDGVLALARALGAPLLAEACSGLRFGDRSGHAVAHAEALLRARPDGWVPDAVVRVGGPLTTRALQAWADRVDAKVVALAEAGRLADPQLRAQVTLEGPTGPAARALAEKLGSAPQGGAWLAAWRRADGAVAAALQRELERGSSWGEPMLARALPALLPDGANLVLSSSMPVRDVDAFASCTPRPLHVFSSRGASGIDGVTSTAFGVAAATGRRTALLVGDTAFLHDVGGLLWGARLGVPLAVLVVNNGGGRIFGHLPLGQATERLEQLFVMPHGADLAHASALAGARHHRVDSLEGLARTLPDALEGGVHVLEAVVAPEDGVPRHQAAFAAAARGLEASP